MGGTFSNPARDKSQAPNAAANLLARQLVALANRIDRIAAAL
jgi:hypothetical protein